MNRSRALVMSFAIIALVSSTALSGMTAEVPKLQLPAVITSLGQSPDGYTANILAKRAGLKLKYNRLLPPEEVSEYKTLIMAVGASLKGFGSAGVNFDTELQRGKKIVKQVRESNVYLIILHTGGEGRREQMSNKLLDKVADQANYLLVQEDGNKDGYFNKVAEQNKIPLKILKTTLELQAIFKKMFTQE